MDEPLGALDKKLRAHMQLELKHIQQHLHVTVIYVTHDQEEALTMSDRVAVMQGGRIEQVGSPAELYDSPASRFVADFLGESNFLDGDRRLRRARRDAGAAAPPGGLEFVGCRRGAAAGRAARHRRRPSGEAACRRGTRGRGAGPRRQCVQGRGRRGIYVGTSRATAWASAPTAPSPSRCRTALPRGRSPPARRWRSRWSPDDTRLFPARPHEGGPVERQETLRYLLMLLPGSPRAGGALRLSAPRHRQPQCVQDRLHARTSTARSSACPSISRCSGQPSGSPRWSRSSAWPSAIRWPTCWRAAARGRRGS